MLVLLLVLCLLRIPRFRHFVFRPLLTRAARVILEGIPAISENLCWRIVVHPTAYRDGVRQWTVGTLRLYQVLALHLGEKKSIANMSA